jgi:Tfp pilus assembly protein PilE
MKAVIKIDYTNYILDTDKAVAILNLLEGAEIYEQKYHAAKDGVESFYTQHIYDDEKTDTQLLLIKDEMYRMYKLAGKPERN